MTRVASVDQRSGSRRLTTALISCGLVAGPLFVAVFLIEGMRPGYEPARLPISLLSVGPDGWTQVANFVVDGLLVVAFAAGLWRTRGAGVVASAAGPILLAVVGCALVVAGIFTTDPADGYPPGVLHPGESTTHATVHDIASLVVFLGLPFVVLAFARADARRADRGWAVASAVVFGVLAVLLVGTVAGFNGVRALRSVAGLLQRSWVVVGWAWMFALAARVLRALAPATTDGDA